MPADAEMCDVCRNERKKSKKKDAPVIQICPECNENPVVPGEEFCAACLREHKRLEAIEKIALNQQDALDEEEEEALEEALAAEEEMKTWINSTLCRRIPTTSRRKSWRIWKRSLAWTSRMKKTGWPCNGGICHCRFAPFPCG